MGPIFSRNNPPSSHEELADEDKQALIHVARRSIEHGLETGHPFVPDPADYAPPLQAKRACFVTLMSGDTLRGCIGTLEQEMPLIIAVAQTAYSAAFRDPRMPSVQCDELDTITISISILSDLYPLVFESEKELLAKIRPGIDGLLLKEGNRTGTLLPSVWENISDPVEFLQSLKMKAGLNPFYWSDSLTVDYYTTESFSG